MKKVLLVVALVVILGGTILRERQHSAEVADWARITEQAVDVCSKSLRLVYQWKAKFEDCNKGLRADHGI